MGHWVRAATRDWRWRFFAACVVLAIPLTVGLCAWAASDLPPCETLWTRQVTGVQRYAGHRVECFHGAVVKVSP